jgi:Tail-tube assembly protein
MAETITTSIDVLKGKKILQYPLNLGSSDKDDYGDLNQYMMFRINTDTKASKLKDDSSSGQVYLPNSGSRATGVSTQLTASKNDDTDARLKFGDAAVDGTQWVVQKGVVRLDKVIVLPMPSDHVVATSITYNQDYSPSMLTKAGDMVNQMGNGVASELATLGKNVAASGSINVLKSMITNKGGDATSLNAMLAEERLALNPKKEVMFSGFGFRQFSFRYSFAPKSAEESAMVQEIIETFRYYSLPEISAAKLFYLMPAEFEISFMYGQKDNPMIPRITTSVLQRVSVNYSPHSVWAVLPDGSPVAIDMTLDFLELELIDRNRVYKKNSPITSGF